MRKTWGLVLFKNQIQTASTSPCRTQVQPAASFLVCSLIFIESWPQVSICNQKGILCPLFKNSGGFSS
ncbi:hypothetical protein B7706_02380 [Streptococcus oralis subsp. dentisani]|nr:hypothetical protein B7706_02380 [Streptococcus oralis subsp. dentisani]ORO85572.1 hypothetical protein B7704_00440 [Streptococcus oralis subsp. dentisani]